MKSGIAPFARRKTVIVLTGFGLIVWALTPGGVHAQSTTDLISAASNPIEESNGNSSWRTSMSLFHTFIVAFSSSASNLVAEDTNGTEDVFVWDFDTSTMTRASVAGISDEANGSSTAPAVAHPGIYVAFHSNASNLVANDSNNNTDVFVRDLRASETTLMSVNDDGEQGNDVSYCLLYTSDAADDLQPV